MGSDSIGWGIAIAFASLARYDFMPGDVDWTGWATITLIAGMLQVVFGNMTGLYRGCRRVGSYDEVSLLFFTVAATTCGATALNVLLGEPRFVPLTGTIAGGFVAFCLLGGIRYLWRQHTDRLLRPDSARATKLVVFGAGEGGMQVVTSLLRNPDCPYYPVAFLDDAPAKRKLRISGVPVLGSREQMVAVARRTGADALLIAVPSADGKLLRELSNLAADAGLDVMVLPPVVELLAKPVSAADIRPLTDADLLGRHELDTDIGAIAGYLTGKRVLVTGAGGSIGSELCRQIYRYAPSELIMLDRDESALHAVQLSIEGRAMLDTPNLQLIDIRDRDRLEQLFAERQPEVVFHAAALKHLTLLEQHPGEAVRTNVWATLDLLEVACASGVDRFVNVSTDKAADPTSVLGYTKRLAEQLTAHVASSCSGTNFMSVRFGNVLGSRGSVLTAFRSQIANGGPITVTDPDVTRYFMTVEEACQLVIQAGAFGSDGDALVLDMGEPVKIDDVARRMAAQSDRAIDIVYTGLRPGEKLHEVLLGDGEVDHRPLHPLISHVAVPPLDPDVARTLRPASPTAELVELLCGLSGGTVTSPLR
jgi:FlaA1/EpsC-like NDP-sugar epimerase